MLNSVTYFFLNPFLHFLTFEQLSYMTSSLPKQKGHLSLPVYFVIFLGFHKLVQITQISVSNAVSPLS